MSVLVVLGCVCLFVLAGLVVWPSSRFRRWLLILLPLSLRLTLSAALLLLSAAAVVPLDSLGRLVGEDGRAALSQLRGPVRDYFPLFCSLAALSLALLALPCLVVLDFSRALLGHAAWLNRLNSRQPRAAAPGRPAITIPRQAEPAPTPAPRPRERRTLDELLG
jgi:hypothetical protein